MTEVLSSNSVYCVRYRVMWHHDVSRIFSTLRECVPVADTYILQNRLSA